MGTQGHVPIFLTSAIRGLDTMTSMFRIAELQFGYGRLPVLKGITCDVASGEFVALVGPNGAGKSTFLKVLAGLLPGYTGTVDFAGQAVKAIRSKDLAKRIAFVPQETHMVFPFSAGEIVMMGRLPHRARGLFDTARD